MRGRVYDQANEAPPLFRGARKLSLHAASVPELREKIVEMLSSQGVMWLPLSSQACGCAARMTLCVNINIMQMRMRGRQGSSAWPLHKVDRCCEPK